MATLKSLPTELIYIILKHIPDLDNLLNLIQASRDFLSVFQGYKKTIRDSVLKNEILQHKREAFFIEVLLDRLPRLKISAEKHLEDLATQYEQFDEKDPDARYSLTTFNGNDTSEPTDIPLLVVNNHRHMRSACKTFVEVEISSREWRNPLGEPVSSTPATPSEKQRIISACYKLWVLLIVYPNRPRMLSVNYLNLPCEDKIVGQLFKSWEFWGCMEVRSLKNFYWRRLFPSPERLEKHEGSDVISFIAGVHPPWRNCKTTEILYC
ncbi:hypothetical protein ABW20_dc0108538 [Dactylellina cionopaga]|nr:hypothetical protein ABW20_dc0108538 [Dactylellina cionopaga]